MLVYLFVFCVLISLLHCNKLTTNSAILIEVKSSIKDVYLFLVIDFYLKLIFFHFKMQNYYVILNTPFVAKSFLTKLSVLKIEFIQLKDLIDFQLSQDKEAEITSQSCTAVMSLLPC